MRNALRLVAAFGGASIFGAAFLVACSDDTDINPVAEGGAETGTDSPPGETSVIDGGPDTAPPFDGGFVVDTFGDQVATELCKSLARCCYGSPTPADGGADGGSFDLAACMGQFSKIGFEGSIIGTEIKDAGNVVLDQVNADDCLKKITALTCNLPGPEFTAARAACFGAYRGKVLPNAACKSSVECSIGHFCNGAVDGGSGVCNPLRPLNGACGDFTTNAFLGEEACSYRGSGDTGNYCKFKDFSGGGGGSTLDAGEWKCAAAEGAGTSCANSVWCKATTCQVGNVCATPDNYFQYSCDSFRVP
jgi:hypothetical protein